MEQQPRYDLRASRVLPGLWTLLSLACNPPTESASAEDVLRLPVASPTTKDTALERAYLAEIRAARHVELRSRLGGVLEVVAVDEGQTVREGQRLFTVNARALMQEVLVAKAATLGASTELRAAELELQNTKLLEEKKIVSAAELALAEARVQIAHAKVEEARQREAQAAVELSHAEVKAPFDGTINRVPRKVGSSISEDELLTTLTDAREVFAYFKLTEREYLEYLGTARGERRVTLVLADGSAFPHEGVVDAITNEFDVETGTLAYRARFPNPDGVLKHGSSGKVVLTTELRAALLVPQKATFDVQGDISVFVLDSDDVARARKVRVKARLADSFVCDGGLAPDDRFVLEGVQKVRDGVKIAVAPPSDDTPSAPKGL